MSADRLGRGLEALIRPKTERKKSQIVRSASPEKPGVTKIPIKSIKPNPKQPRRDFDENALAELAASIKEKGVVTPITVREADNGYELVAGERRWRAAKKLRLRAIPAYVVVIKNDAEMMEMALIENIQRENLNPIEEATAYRRLADEYGLTQIEIAQSVGKDRATVANYQRLLNLPGEVRADVGAGLLTMGHARALAGLTDARAQRHVCREIKVQDLSVRETETLVKRIASPKAERTGGEAASDVHTRAAEDRLRLALGTKVRIVRRGKSGRIEINFSSETELQRLFEHMTRG